MDADKVFNIKVWSNPAAKYAAARVGSAELVKVKQRPGVYRMEGINGYTYYSLARSIELTELKINGKTWMVCDPLHWYGMGEYMHQMRGRLLCAGLGLGLMVWWAAIDNEINDRLTSITVYENNPDVVALIKPLLPHIGNLPVKIVCDDFYSITPPQAKTYDSVLWDLAVGTRAETTEDIRAAMEASYKIYNHCPMGIFGLKIGGKPAIL